MTLRGVRYPHIHHVDGNHDNDDPGNLLLVCPTCHTHLHGHKLCQLAPEQIVDMKDRQGLTFREMAVEGKVSRQRIHQIYHEQKALERTLAWRSAAKGNPQT